MQVHFSFKLHEPFEKSECGGESLVCETEVLVLGSVKKSFDGKCIFLLNRLRKVSVEEKEKESLGCETVA